VNLIKISVKEMQHPYAAKKFGRNDPVGEYHFVTTVGSKTVELQNIMRKNWLPLINALQVFKRKVAY
jgi:hypothetical protein